mgnify:CR=1 FL=1
MNPSDFEHILPITAEVEKGKTYLWCSCGQSKTQPFCDKQDCGCKALAFTAELNETINCCRCKQTKTPPFCDGSHASLLLEAIKNKT